MEAPGDGGTQSLTPGVTPPSDASPPSSNEPMGTVDAAAAGSVQRVARWGDEEVRSVVKGLALKDFAELLNPVLRTYGLQIDCIKYGDKQMTFRYRRMPEVPPSVGTRVVLTRAVGELKQYRIKQRPSRSYARSSFPSSRVESLVFLGALGAPVPPQLLGPTTSPQGSRVPGTQDPERSSVAAPSPVPPSSTQALRHDDAPSPPSLTTPSTTPLQERLSQAAQAGEQRSAQIPQRHAGPLRARNTGRKRKWKDLTAIVKEISMRSLARKLEGVLAPWDLEVNKVQLGTAFRVKRKNKVELTEEQEIMLQRGTEALFAMRLETWSGTEPRHARARWPQTKVEALAFLDALGVPVPPGFPSLGPSVKFRRNFATAGVGPRVGEPNEASSHREGMGTSGGVKRWQDPDISEALMALKRWKWGEVLDPVMQDWGIDLISGKGKTLRLRRSKRVLAPWIIKKQQRILEQIEQRRLCPDKTPSRHSSSRWPRNKVEVLFFLDELGVRVPDGLLAALTDPLSSEAAAVVAGPPEEQEGVDGSSMDPAAGEEQSSEEDTHTMGMTQGCSQQDSPPPPVRQESSPSGCHQTSGPQGTTAQPLPELRQKGPPSTTPPPPAEALLPTRPVPSSHAQSQTPITQSLPGGVGEESRGMAEPSHRNSLGMSSRGRTPLPGKGKQMSGSLGAAEKGVHQEGPHPLPTSTETPFREELSGPGVGTGSVRDALVSNQTGAESLPRAGGRVRSPRKMQDQQKLNSLGGSHAANRPSASGLQDGKPVTGKRTKELSWKDEDIKNVLTWANAEVAEPIFRFILRPHGFTVTWRRGQHTSTIVSRLEEPAEEWAKEPSEHALRALALHRMGKESEGSTAGDRSDLDVSSLKLPERSAELCVFLHALGVRVPAGAIDHLRETRNRPGRKRKAEGKSDSSRTRMKPSRRESMGRSSSRSVVSDGRGNGGVSSAPLTGSFGSDGGSTIKAMGGWFERQIQDEDEEVKRQMQQMVADHDRKIQALVENFVRLVELIEEKLRDCASESGISMQR